MNVQRVNMQSLLERVEQDHELLNELITIFVDEFPVKLQELREAMGRSDLARTMVASHALKGMLMNLSITQAAWCAARIEQMARSGQATSLKEALGALEKEVHGLLPELQQHLAGGRQ